MKDVDLHILRSAQLYPCSLIHATFAGFCFSPEKQGARDGISFRLSAYNNH